MMFDVCMTTQYLDSASKLLEHEQKILSKMLNINRRIWGSNFELWQPRVKNTLIWWFHIWHMWSLCPYRCTQTTV